jgi:hypothetical protein
MRPGTARLFLCMPWRHTGQCRFNSTLPNLSVRWRQVVRFTPWMLYAQGKYISYQFNRWLSRLHSKAWYFTEKKNLFPLPGVEPQILGSQAHSLLRPYKNTNNTFPCQCNIEDHMDCHLHTLIQNVIHNYDTVICKIIAFMF